MTRDTAPTIDKAYGQRLRSALYSPRALAVLEQYQCGWLDGGCGVLALALQERFPDAQLVGICGSFTRGSPRRLQHVVLKVGPDAYLDGEGLSTSRALLRLWHTQERCPNARLEPVTWEDIANAGIEVEDDLIATLVEILDETGSWRLRHHPNPRIARRHRR